MMNELLPIKRNEFDKYVSLFFPNVYDIKCFQHILSPAFDGGLNKLADLLGVDRIGTVH